MFDARHVVRHNDPFSDDQNSRPVTSFQILWNPSVSLSEISLFCLEF